MANKALEATAAAPGIKTVTDNTAVSASATPLPSGCASAMRSAAHRMKKRLIIFLFLFLVAVLGFWCLPRSRQLPTVDTSFIGFTNLAGRQEALFALSNPPPASVSLHSVRRLSSITEVSTREAGPLQLGKERAMGIALRDQR